MLARGRAALPSVFLCSPEAALRFPVEEALPGGQKRSCAEAQLLEKICVSGLLFHDFHGFVAANFDKHTVFGVHNAYALEVVINGSCVFNFN